MTRGPPGSTRTYTLFPYTTLFRSAYLLGIIGVIASALARPAWSRSCPKAPSGQSVPVWSSPSTPWHDLVRRVESKAHEKHRPLRQPLRRIVSSGPERLL